MELSRWCIVRVPIERAVAVTNCDLEPSLILDYNSQAMLLDYTRTSIYTALVGSDVSSYLSPLRNPLLVVHPVALLVLAAKAAFHLAYI